MFGSLVAAVGGMLGSTGTKVGETLWQNYENRKAVSKANSYNFGMWQAENEYNKPINQMARLQEAGLNPNLVYGGGATTLSAHSQGAHEAVQRAPDILDAIGQYANLRQVDATTENTKAQTQSVNATRIHTEKSTEEINHVIDNLKTEKMILANKLAQETMNTKSQALDLAIQQLVYPLQRKYAIKNAQHMSGGSYWASQHFKDWTGAFGSILGGGSVAAQWYNATHKPSVVYRGYGHY